MNLVALLIAPAVVTLTLDGQDTIRIGIALGATAIIIGSLVASRRYRGVGEEIVDDMVEAVGTDPQPPAVLGEAARPVAADAGTNDEASHPVAAGAGKDRKV